MSRAETGGFRPAQRKMQPKRNSMKYTEEKGKMKVLVVGPDSRRTKGGIASVIQGMREDAWLTGQTGMAFYSSCYEGNVFAKILYEARQIARFGSVVKDYDLVHIHMSVNGSARRKMQYARIAKRHGKKVILHIHSGNFVDYYRALGEKKRAKLQSVLREADAVVALSQSWKEALTKEIGLTNCVAIFNGISLKAYRNGFKTFEERPIDFLFLGRLGIEKGTDNLLKVLKSIKEEGKPFRCVLAGDGPVQDYSQWVNEAQLGEQVTFAGWVKGKQKQELLQNARILLLPSRREGMPMSILEAMAYGEAVVSTRVGGIPEVVEEGGSGFLIEPDDEHSLYRTIRRLLDDRRLAERMGRRGREIVKEKFDLEQIHRQLYALYSRVIGV